MSKVESRMLTYPDLQSQEFISVNPLKKVCVFTRVCVFACVWVCRWVWVIPPRHSPYTTSSPIALCIAFTGSSTDQAGRHYRVREPGYP